MAGWAVSESMLKGRLDHAISVVGCGGATLLLRTRLFLLQLLLSWLHWLLLVRSGCENSLQDNV